jgi:hypothetical protein
VNPVNYFSTPGLGLPPGCLKIQPHHDTCLLLQSYTCLVTTPPIKKEKAKKETEIKA